MNSAPLAGKLMAMRMRPTIAVAAILGLAGCAMVAAITGPVRLIGHAVPASASHTAALPDRGQRRASLVLLEGAASVTVSSAALPGQLLRAWTPADSGIRPQLVVTAGTVQVDLDGTGRSGPGALSIQLSSSVRWQLRFSGGSSHTDLNIGNGHVSGIDFTAGSSVIAMTLPRPSGTVTITLAGGASQVSVRLPAGVPARLRLYGGASAATVGGRSYTGIAGGTVLTPSGWTAAVDRYDVAAPAGVSTISVTR